MMFNQAYDDTQEDDQQEARADEREIIERSIEMMAHSDQYPEEAKSRIAAMYFTHRLWSHFLSDLASDENTSPAETKASLISIGIFILKHIEKMRNSPTVAFRPIREISETIVRGLR